ncbi:MAG: hypothetical protein AB7Q97_18070 [Gammaproteobacteria bacterium]
MTSFLKSRFNLTDRRAVCLAGDQVFVHCWIGGALADALVFDATEAGLNQFERYLNESALLPTYMLVDIVEEEYRQETIPHVFGGDRRALIERKQARLFRGTPYSHAVLQGREPEGRRDDRMLFTALMNPAIVQPWADVMVRNKVPLAGIHSLPLLSERLLERLEIKGENVLLVTLQSSSGLRQSFFRAGQLKISRLAKMPRLGTVPFAGQLIGEVEKLRRYLNSLRLLSRDAPLEVYALSHGDTLDELREHCRDGEQVRYRLVDLAQVRERMGMPGGEATPYADRVFAQLLLQAPGPNQYAGASETRYYRMHRARNGLSAAAAVMLLGAVAVSGFYFMQGLALKQEALGARQKADFYQTRYELARENLPRTAVEPADIERGVGIAETMVGHRAVPTKALLTISAALAGHPRLAVERIDWAAGADPNRAIGSVDGEGGDMAETATRKSTSEPVPGQDGESKHDYYQIAVVGGRIAEFDGDYRAAIADVAGFADDLRKQPAVHAVRVVAQPLDVRSDTALEGGARANAGPPAAGFTVRVVLGMGHAEG